MNRDWLETGLDENDFVRNVSHYFFVICHCLDRMTRNESLRAFVYFEFAIYYFVMLLLLLQAANNNNNKKERKEQTKLQNQAIKETLAQ